MTCDEVRQHPRDYQQGRARLETQKAVRAHLDGCAGCTRADAVEQELTRLLEQRLPQHPASLALKRGLAARWSQAPTGRAWWSRWRSSLVPALAAAAVVLVAAPVVYYERAASGAAREQSAMVAEAVNDHLRLLSSQHPLDVESGGVPHVEPWVCGRLGFTPGGDLEGDAAFPLQGGGVAHFPDPQAPAFDYPT